MKYDFLIKPEVLSYLFLPSSQKTGNDLISARINNNKLLINSSIRSEYEEYFKSKGLLQLYQDWLTMNITMEDSLLKPCQQLTIENEKDIFLKNSQKDSIIIGDYSPKDIRDYPTVKFIFEEDIRRPKKSIIGFEELKKTVRNYGRLKEWFSVFEPIIELQVLQNQEAKLLEEYIFKFIRGTDITIQDHYLPRNGKHMLNFEKYILPHIKDKNVTFNISSKNGSIEKKILTDKYGFNVRCYSEENVHTSFIEDENYRIKLGYRLLIFGEQGKTKREMITVIKK